MMMMMIIMMMIADNNNNNDNISTNNNNVMLKMTHGLMINNPFLNSDVTLSFRHQLIFHLTLLPTSIVEHFYCINFCPAYSLNIFPPSPSLGKMIKSISLLPDLKKLQGRTPITQSYIRLHQHHHTSIGAGSGVAGWGGGGGAKRKTPPPIKAVKE